MTTIGYKLFRVRKDGTLGPLFINARQRIPIGEWLDAEDHPTKGFAHRPGWHAAASPEAPHLSERGRRWFVVELKGVTEHQRPEHQGGLWYTAEQMRVVRRVRPSDRKITDILPSWRRNRATALHRRIHG